MLLALGLLVGLAVTVLVRQPSPRPAWIFVGYTNSPATIERFITLPKNTPVALFCLTNPGPRKLALTGELVLETKTNRAGGSRFQSFQSFLSEGWLIPGDPQWVLFPAPSQVSQWRLSARVYHPLPGWLGRQQTWLKAIGAGPLLAQWQERSISGTWVLPSLSTNPAAPKIPHIN